MHPDGHLAAIVESSNDAIVSKDLNGIILTWNAGAELVYGYSAEEVIGKPMRILLPQTAPPKRTRSSNSCGVGRVSTILKPRASEKTGRKSGYPSPSLQSGNLMGPLPARRTLRGILANANSLNYS